MDKRRVMMVLSILLVVPLMRGWISEVMLALALQALLEEEVGVGGYGNPMQLIGALPLRS
jgi:hypothetical protein